MRTFEAEPDVFDGLHFAADYQQFRFRVEYYTVEIGRQPIKSELRSLAAGLPM